MVDQYIKPDKRGASIKAQKANDVANWTLSYRLKGLTLGLVAAAFYSYSYAGYWSIKLLIASAILGYFLGWLVGRFYYTKS